MNKYLSIILIILFFAPVLVFGQEVDTFNSPSNLTESVNETSDFFSVIQKTMEVGGEVFKILKRIIEIVDNWLQNTIGINFSELLKSIFNAVIGILEIILDLIRRILPE